MVALEEQEHNFIDKMYNVIYDAHVWCNKQQNRNWALWQQISSSGVCSTPPAANSDLLPQTVAVSEATVIAGYQKRCRKASVVGRHLEVEQGVDPSGISTHQEPILFLSLILLGQQKWQKILTEALYPLVHGNRNLHWGY